MSVSMGLPKVLIVDDRPANRLVLKRLLSREEVMLLEADSGNETLTLCLEHDFALILLDVNMPEMDGYEVAEILRGDTQTRGIPIIFVTAAYSDELHRLRGYDVGAVDYIQKPIDEITLLAKVRIFLELFNRRWQQEEQALRLQEKTTLLEQEIEERVRVQQALEVAKDEAEAANKVKVRFLATMSHELRTPLNGILGMTQLLDKTQLDERQRNLLGFVKKSGKTLLNVLNDILDFSKIQEDRLVLERIPLDLGEVMRDAVDLFSWKEGEERTKLTLILPDSRPEKVWGDPTRLRQVMFNLVGNAVKFTDRGEITLVVRTVAEDDHHIRLYHGVRDTGIGISAQAQGNLFEPFFQADGSTTRRYGGSGLGLAICRRLVRMMGGEILCESTPGEGSLFHFTLDYEKLTEPASRTGSTLQVLLLDGDPVHQVFVIEMLKGLGCQSLVVHDIQEAIQRVAEGGIDLALLELAMIPQEGESRQRLFEQPVVVMVDDLIQEFPEGLDHRLQKPVSPEALAIMIGKIKKN